MKILRSNRLIQTVCYRSHSKHKKQFESLIKEHMNLQTKKRNLGEIIKMLADSQLIQLISQSTIKFVQFN